MVPAGDRQHWRWTLQELAWHRPIGPHGGSGGPQCHPGEVWWGSRSPNAGLSRWRAQAGGREGSSGIVWFAPGCILCLSGSSVWAQGPPRAARTVCSPNSLLVWHIQTVHPCKLHMLPLNTKRELMVRLSLSNPIYSLETLYAKKKGASISTGKILISSKQCPFYWQYRINTGLTFLDNIKEVPLWVISLYN